MFLCTPSVEAAYICIWSVRDLDLESMINLLTRVNKTQLKTNKQLFVEFLSRVIYLALIGNYLSLKSRLFNFIK